MAAIVVAVGLAGGCSQPEDHSFTRPDWRDSVAAAITFPLAQPITLRVGLPSGGRLPAADNPTLQWLREQTNITLEFVGSVDTPGDIAFGEMIRSGRLPDIVAEQRFDPSSATTRRLLVDFLEFPALLPHFSQLLTTDDAARTGTLARTTGEAELLAVGRIDPTILPFEGVLAYRQDLFDRHNLRAESWSELFDAMLELKRLYPDSYPFGGSFSTVMRLMPSWFGSGYDPRKIVYFNTETLSWHFGPFDPGFQDFVSFLVRAYAADLILPDIIVNQPDSLMRSFSSDTVFLAPHTGPTGPLFPIFGDGYGSLTAEGVWDNAGRWVSALPIPQRSDGAARWTGASRHSVVGPGWVVYNQSAHVAESIALLDFLYSDIAAAVLTLGPPGPIWTFDAERLTLTTTAADIYRDGGIAALEHYITEQIGAFKLPIVGRVFDYYQAFGYPQTPSFDYYRHHDLATNRPIQDVMVDPGVRVPLDRQFAEANADLSVALSTLIESNVANFMVGRRDLTEYEAFLAEARRMGAEELVGRYNQQAIIPNNSVLAPLMR